MVLMLMVSPLARRYLNRVKEVVKNVVPTPAGIGIIVDDTPESKQQAAVLQSIITKAICDIGRKLVDNGITVTEVNCNWGIAVASIYDRISSVGGTSGVSFSKEYLAEISEAYGQWSDNAGKSETGRDATMKMIKGRFNIMSARRYINVLPMIAENIETMFKDGLEEEDQQAHEAVFEYLLERIAKAQEPEEEVSGDLF